MKRSGAFSYAHQDLRVDHIPNIGKGVFATANIKKGTLLTIFGGCVMTLKEEAKLPAVISDIAHQIHQNFVLGVTNKNQLGLTDYYNHSCNPNAGFKGQIFLVAMRNIKKGEQVVFDYAMVLHKSIGINYRLKCFCGAKNCRKVVTMNDWRKLELQKKYKGYFQYYIEEEIAAQKKSR